MVIRIEPDAEPIPGYRLIERIGSGGFGDVWKAEAPGGLLKAIKIIHGDLGALEPDSGRKAEQELRALKRVQAVRHPYLLSLERYDIIDGRLLIVMELADCNLWDRFREYRVQNQQGIPRAELLRYMEETAEVLDMMINQHQLQHLDIKPQNLFLIYNHVKVADFGLVKDLEGVRCKVTGGVTPVYAAPETFDGIVTRFCDQYSLGIVYQELLTGVRPFNGATMQHLLMQHLHGQPDLSSLPPADRPAIARALAKKPEDRHPSCIALVRSLMQISEPATTLPTSAGSIRSELMPSPTTANMTFPPNSSSGLIGGDAWNLNAVMPPMDTPITQMPYRREDSHTPTPSGVTQSSMPFIAPPEQTGPGAIRPALIIGLGHTGLHALLRFRRNIVERFGSFANMPNLKMMFIDTDPETVQLATTSRSRVAMTNDEVITTRLNRPTHYLKPRRGGRSLIEGWFDPQMLYRIPRNPMTMGMRALGRLAYCDHFRPIADRMRKSLEECTHPDSLTTAARNARMELRTNRPIVYVVTSLGGGTGSGMFLDVAYTARSRLKQLGYPEPEVVGLLLLPAVDNAPARNLMMGNTFAALTELNHFSRPETMFTGFYDDPSGTIADQGPPFQRVFCFGLPAAANSASPAGHPIYQQVSDHLRRDLTSQFGRCVEKARSEKHSADSTCPVPVSITNVAAFSWPRQELLSQASYWLCVKLLKSWITGEPPAISAKVQKWLTEQWVAQELNAESVISRLQKAVETGLGKSAEALFQAEADPFVPRGWRSRDPDPAKLHPALIRIQQIVGVPEELGLQRQANQIDGLLNEAAEQLHRVLAERLARLVPALIDRPDYRLVGAEEGIRQIARIIGQMIDHYEPLAVELAKKSIDGYFLLNRYLSGESGRKRPSPAEIAESLRLWPKWRYEHLVLRQVTRIYGALRNQMSDQLRELQFCRGRLEDLAHHFHETRLPIAEVPANLLPVGCPTIREAVEKLINTLTQDDLRNLDKRAQEHIEQEFNALFDVCMNSVNMIDNLRSLLMNQTRQFLNARLGEADVVDMFLARFPNQGQVIQTLQQAYNESIPGMVRRSPFFASQEISLLAIPPGEQGERFQMIAQRAFGGVDLFLAPHNDEILIHREYTHVPLIELPQLGTLGANAYGNVCGQAHFTPHSRIDIVHWSEVDQ